MTDNAGASVHQPLGAQTDSPQRRDGAMTSAHNSAQSAEHIDSTNADCHQQCEDAHERGGEARVEMRGSSMSRDHTGQTAQSGHDADA